MNSSFIPPPHPLSARFPLIECVLSIRGGLLGEGEEEEGGGRGRGGFCGTSRRDERGLSLFYSTRLSSFQLFEASHQTGLNSRRDTISLSSSTTTHHHLLSSPYLAHTSFHPSFPPSLSISTLSSIYLRPPASVHPFTRSQCRSLTTDRRPERGKNELKFKLNVNVKAQILYFLDFLLSV